jgi:adenine-specific DNA methylase
MKKQARCTDQIDFETGGQSEDFIALMRNAQQDLYRLDNPYVGNKRKIVVDIAHALHEAEVEFDSVLDVFSGSGVVGLFFKILGKEVHSNDLLTSSFYNALAFVENEENLSLTEKELLFLCTNDSSHKGDFVQKNYEDRFTWDEGLFLDKYRCNIDLMIEEQNRLLAIDPGFDLNSAQRWLETKKAHAFVTMQNYVMKHCFLGGRLNSGQILAKLDHRLDHKRNNGAEMGFKLEPLPVFPGRRCLADNLDCLLFLKNAPAVDLAYLDPPYGTDQSDYASMFAFCEEYIYSAPLDTLPHLNTSKKFTNRKTFEPHFREVLDLASKKAKTLAISFNDSSWATVNEIENILKEYKKDTTVVNIDHNYKYRKDRSDQTEYLIVGR